MATTMPAQDRNANALRRMRSKNAKNAKKEAELQRREKAAEHQRRGEGVPVNAAAANTDGPRARVTTFGPMPVVNPAGHSPGGDTARPSSGVAARRTADCVCGETVVRGELYVVFTDPDERKVCVPYAPGSGALASLDQPCAHAAGKTCPCGASLSR